jgi:hypothetical protein
MIDIRKLSTSELEAGLPTILESPKDNGLVRMIVRRPNVENRQCIDIGKLDIDEGLVGDNWRTRGSPMTQDGSAHPEMQLNLMNSRVVDLVATSKARWPLAGDQFYVDLDLSWDNLPAGTRLQMGTAMIEITSVPHLGCRKFMSRFGRDALMFVNSEYGKRLNLRGICAKVVKAGTVKVNDTLSRQAWPE